MSRCFLHRLGDLQPIPDRGRKLRVAYHDACHLANAQGVRAEPRKLLRLIPGVEVCEIADSHLCCGSAGTYNIDQPEIANSLGQQKVANVLATAPDIVATGNIGCMTQLATHLGQARIERSSATHDASLARCLRIQTVERISIRFFLQFNGLKSIRP